MVLHTVLVMLLPEQPPLPLPLSSPPPLLLHPSPSPPLPLSSALPPLLRPSPSPDLPPPVSGSVHSAYSLSPSESLETFLYPGLIEEIVEVLELPDQHLMVDTSPHNTSPHNTTPHLTTQHLTTPHHNTTPHHTTRHLTTPHLTTQLLSSSTQLCASAVHSPSPFPPPHPPLPSPPPPGHQSSCTASTDRCCPLGEEPKAERDCGEHWCLCLPRLPPRSGPGGHCFSHRCGVCVCVCVCMCVLCVTCVCLSVSCHL